MALRWRIVLVLFLMAAAFALRREIVPFWRWFKVVQVSFFGEALP